MLPILLAVMAIAIIIAIFVLVSGRTRNISGVSGGGGKKFRDKSGALKNANKRLAQNPRDPEALKTVADIYFEEESWDEAMRAYETLNDILAFGQVAGIDSFTVSLNYALAAMKLHLTEQAYKGFTSARRYNADSFEVNYNLGILEFEHKNYEKAIQLLQVARKQDPESPAVLRYLGHALFRLKKPKEAMSFIRKAIDLAPDDKESLYTLAECYHEANQVDQALRIFSHLRPDPIMGPNACLISGMIHTETRQDDLAIQDFEIGLKHQSIKPDTLAEIRYRLAQVYIKRNEIGKAMPLLKVLQAENSSYKDVNLLIGKYQELNANRNLQIFLIAPSADFVALCRKIVMTYFPKAKVKISNISVNKNEWADILAEIDTSKWSELIMFRFIRTQGSIGELIVRDFHAHIKEVKAGKGICVTVGSFSEEAKRYTEARLIDLIEKERLSAILNSVDAKAAAITAAKK
ncbi:MAG: tetratricopeptide repeat protein [Treponema sp.]|jgi:tetratricopeptide (TPR) repeat protein|nr:tetratricopeptide repeat protein [Treponema sp.]